MSNKLRKIVASVMAVATFAMGAVGINASAAEITTPEVFEVIEEYSGPTGYVTFGSGATAGIYRDSSQINISTSWNSGSTVYVKLTNTSGAPASGTKDKYGYDGYVSLNFTGSGFTKAYSYHSAGGSSISLSR